MFQSKGEGQPSNCFGQPSTDWICDCRLAFDWLHCPSEAEVQFPWEADMHDICRRMEDESEGKVSFDKLKKIICRTFDAFVKVYGYGWLLGLIKLYMLLHCESCYIVTCVMMICHELRFDHVSFRKCIFPAPS